MVYRRIVEVVVLGGVFLFLSSMALPLWGDSAVMIWEEPLVIPTYRLGSANPNPMFYDGRAYQGAKGTIYPYPFMDGLTDIREDKTYRAVFLENQYLKLCVLPELGGRIFSALDKTNHYDFFYHQHVIKPALIGMLGAWISGGVEWNFPHHHRATSFMPVDHIITTDPGGSKTLWVGETELRHRMRWIVGITLYPDRSYIEVTGKLFNRTPFAHSFLFWTNTAVHAHPSYQVIFPGSTAYVTYHGKNQFSCWPVSREFYNRVDYTEGIDVSWWKNHPAPTSMFAWNSQGDFLAGYDHKRDAGVICVTPHPIAPGKKFWTWGTGEKGRMWEKILTETDGPYLELMVGAYSDNQPDYSWLKPYEIKTFKQYWYPLQKIEGVKNATREACVNLDFTEEKLKIGVNTTRPYRQARIILKAGEKTIFEETKDIRPENPYRQEIIPPDSVTGDSVSLTLMSSQNRKLVSYAPEVKERPPMPNPVAPPPLPEKIKTIEELYLTGLRLEQFHHPSLEPYPYYEEALQKDPGDYRVNTALGTLYSKRGMYKKAEIHLKKALERATMNYTRPKDGEAFYVLGGALRGQGRTQAAYDAFYNATWDYAFYSAAHYQLAELSCSEEDFSQTLDHLDRALSTHGMNTKALNLKAAMLRKEGRFKEAGDTANTVLSMDPLDFFAKNEICLIQSERGLQEAAQKSLDQLQATMRDAVQSYLELADDYGGCGLWDEAIDILSRFIEVSKKDIPKHPLVYYYLGYYWDRKGNKEKAAEYFSMGEKIPPHFCFPFRLTSIDVMNQAARFNPKDAHIPYYLGNLSYDLQPERAVKEWEKSRDLDDSFAMVHRNLSMAYAKVENNIPKAIKSLEKAMALDRENARFYYELDLLYEVEGVSLQERLALLEENHKVIKKRDDALSREILLFTQSGRYEKAIHLLANHHFHTWEGGGKIHNVFVDTYLLLGLIKFKEGRYEESLKNYEAALTYPDNLEVGQPYHDVRKARTYYLIGTACEALGQSEKAAQAFEKAAELEIRPLGSEYQYYQGLALEKLGRTQEGQKKHEALIAHGKKQLEAGTSQDFFAKFGSKRSQKAQKANAHYLMGLGFLGLENSDQAKIEFKEALAWNPNHLWARAHLERME